MNVPYSLGQIREKTVFSLMSFARISFGNVYRWLLLLVGLTTLWICPVSASLHPISNKRFEIGNTQADLSSRFTGKVSTFWPNGGFTEGSGVLVGKRHVLTAAHNIYNSAFGGWAKVIGFIPAQHGNIKPFGISTANAMRVPRYWLEHNGSWIRNDENHDIGIFRIRHSLGIKTGGWMQMTAYNYSPDPSIGMNLNGYDGDVFSGKHQITRSSSVRTIVDWPAPNTRFLAHWYPFNGSSGGPVWYKSGNIYHVIGVSTAMSGRGQGHGVKLTSTEFLPLMRDFIVKNP